MPPIELDTPITSQPIPTIDNVTASIDGESGRVVIVVFANGSPHPIAVYNVTHSAFLTALQGATGDLKNRLYSAALTQLGKAGTIT